MYVRFNYPKAFNNLIEDFFETDVMPSRSVYPLVDIVEKNNETIVIAELPGVKKEDIKITFENNLLTISGERKPYEIPEDARVILNEVRVRKFNRSIEFKNDVDVNNISAEMNNGILSIVLPKSESAQIRKIEVN